MMKESKSKNWIEMRRMDSLLKGMKCLELGSSEVEWSEHEMLEKWMLDTYKYGLMLDADDVMRSNEEIDENAKVVEDSMKLVDDDTNMEYEDMHEQDVETY